MRIYVYGLFDPRTPSVIEYVGQSGLLSGRIKSHTAGHDKKTKEWVAELSKAGLSPGFSILEETTEYNALSVETKHIQRLQPRLNDRTTKKAFTFEVSPIVSLRDMEGKYLQWALDFFGGNKLAACRALGIGRQTLYNKMKSFGIEI